MKNYNLHLGVILFLFFLPNLLTAQAPGYLGKKLYLELATGVSPALDGPTQNNRGYDNILGYDFENQPASRGLGFNLAIDGALNYVIKRNGSIGLVYSRYTTGVLTQLSTTNDPYNSELFDNLHKLKVSSIGLRYTFFRMKRGALAPVGRSYYIGLERMSAQAEIIDQLPVNGATSGTFDFPDLDQTHKFTALSMGFHKTTALTDQLLLRFGVDMNIPTATLLGRISDLLGRRYWAFEEYNEDPNQVIFEVETFRRMFYHGLVRFEVGVGYLLL